MAGGTQLPEDSGEEDTVRSLEVQPKERRHQGRNVSAMSATSPTPIVPRSRASAR